MVARLFPYCHNIMKAIGLQNKIYKDTEPLQHIIDNIYLGDYRAADNPTILSQYNITHIINCAFNLPCKYPQYKYLALNLKDEVTQEILDKMEESYQFIKQNSSSNILVHCVFGKSRSGSVVLYYLMKEKGMKYQEAYDFVHKIRSVLSPNEGFKRQLLSKEEEFSKNRI